MREFAGCMGPCAARATVLLVSCAAALLPTRGVANEDQGSRPSEQAASALIDFVFSKEIQSQGGTEALSFRDQGYSFESLSDVYRYNLRASHVTPKTAHTFKLKAHPIESPWWWLIRSPEGARAFIKGLRNSLPGLPEGAPHQGATKVLEKALLQRDLIQVHSLVDGARKVAGEPATEAIASEVQAALAEQIRRVVLTEEEYQTLTVLRPKVVPSGFAAAPTLSVSDDYLPTRLVAPDLSWLEASNAGQPFRHFLDYGGRSFIRVYLRAKHLDSDNLLALWRELYRANGTDLHLTGTPRAVPLGLETMLVRSFGVLVADGGFRDSSWPEEVIIRAFKHPKPTLDIQTSDFRGTIFYQYRMSRSDLLRDPPSMGLRRVHDDDEQFFGFFGDVPDPTNSYSDTTTTMRANCISCHSELYYGLSTIFSFERDPDSRAELRELTARRNGGFDVNMPALQSLRMFLERTPDSGSATFDDVADTSSRGRLPNRGEHDIP